MFFALPGILFAMVVGVVLNGAIAAVFGIATQTPIDFNIPPLALGLGIALGFVLPVASNIIPIRVCPCMAWRFLAVLAFHRVSFVAFVWLKEWGGVCVSDIDSRRLDV